ncbi:MAG: HD domain-containing protein [Lachnospiraceae bacterium]|nr:HD domain-containing protein [Lachnospiraceae bacterium]
MDMAEVKGQQETMRSDIEENDMHRLLYSTVAAFTKAIDERTPYNASHTMQVAGYVRGALAFLNRKYREEGGGVCFSAEDCEQIIMAACLHDVGKLVIPLSIMNKSTRMGEGGLERIHQRYLLIRAYLDIDHLEGRLETEAWHRQKEELSELERRIEAADNARPLASEERRYFAGMAGRTYRGGAGGEIPWLTDEEAANLQIEHGTLNTEERKNMEYHAVATEKILKEIHFGKKYDKVLQIAGAHHEFLDGSGYPRCLRGEQIPTGSRLLTIADIYDSLVATDRPYKSPIPADKAKQILREMAEEGKLDAQLVGLFCEYVDTLPEK